MRFEKDLIKGRLAQLVERLVYTENVGGSSPSAPINFKICTIIKNVVNLGRFTAKDNDYLSLALLEHSYLI